MNNTERDKVIAEALGLCWHEWRVLELGLCRCDKCSLQTSATGSYMPDFSTYDGMGLILKLGPKVLGDAWKMFINKQMYAPNSKGEWNVEPIDYDGNIPIDLLQDPDKLADELYQFLKEETDGKG